MVDLTQLYTKIIILIFILRFYSHVYIPYIENVDSTDKALIFNNI